MAYTREQALDTHKDYKETVTNWEYFIRSYNGGYDYMTGQYLNRYNLELDNEFNQRLLNTPCDNHCKNIIQIYSSFLFRVKPTRELGDMANEASLENFLKDTDLDGNDFDSVIKQAQNYSAIYGHCFLILDKPKVTTNTKADELAQDIRPYLSIVTPENVLDWNYKREVNGKYSLDYLKVREEVDKDGGSYIRLWFPDRIDTIYVASQAIYNEFSEIEQLIRLTNHPSLVKTPSVNASAGAGAIIEMPEEIEPNLKPYLLQPSGQNLQSIMDSITKKVESINRIAHTGSVRTTKTQVSSGIALQTEFELLNARLSEKADNLEIAEEQLFRIYALFQNTKFDGEINYPDSFNIRDYSTDLMFYQQAKAINVKSPTLVKEIDKEIARAVVDDNEKLNIIFDEIDTKPEVGEFTQDEVEKETVEEEEV